MKYICTSLLLLCILTSPIHSFEQVLDSVMAIRWVITGDEIELTFICQITLGYCGIGLSDTMTDCDLLVAMTDGTSITLGDYYAYNDVDIPSSDVSLGGVNNLVYVSGGVDSSGNINVTFKRKLVTGDPYDQVIEPDVLTSICWAYLDHVYVWDQHESESKI